MMMFLIMGAAIMMIGVILGHAISSANKNQTAPFKRE